MRSPLRTLPEIAVYLCFTHVETSLPNLRRAYRWVEKYIPAEKRKYRGRNLLVHIDDIDAALSSRTRRAS